MKRISFITFFVAVQILLITLHLHKQSKLIEFSYDKQKNETEKASLLKRKQELTHNLYLIGDPTQVKQFALEKLSFKPLRINQVKRLEYG